MEAKQPDTVEALCAAGANVDAKTAGGETPLYMVLTKSGQENKALAILKTLCKSGADVTAKAWGGLSMLDLARGRTRGNEFCEVLKQYGAKE